MRRSALLSVLLSTALCPALAVAAMKVEPVEWTVDGSAFSGYLVYDGDGTDARPGLVMVPNWMGVNELAVERARQIAGKEYVVLVADVYGAGIRPKNADEAAKAARGAYADGGVSLRARANEAVRVLKAQAGAAPLDPKRIGALGFCFGGSTVLELARSGSDIAGVVSFHGGLDSYLPASGNTIRTSVLVLNGADDASVSAANIADFREEMRAAGADWQFVDFGGAVHCFTQPESDNPPNCVYDARASQRAFAMMRGFFTERFAAE
ncbi:MAG: dienelactone hydrolase family protein [Luteimonas sp.]|nr:dienelactone hydrolase family protein [Luteimonas sp.]